MNNSSHFTLMNRNRSGTVQQNSESNRRARSLRESQTEAERLLWSLLRSKQVCGLKFRRQHPIGPFIADFACESQKIVVELDGDYHDYIQENDLQRQRYLEKQGWRVVRFTNDDVMRDAEAVARAIANHLDIPFSFNRRTSKGSGMMRERAKIVKIEAPNALPDRSRVRPSRKQEGLEDA